MVRVSIAVAVALGACGSPNPCPGQLTCPDMECCPIDYPIECGSQCYQTTSAPACAVTGYYTCVDDNNGGSGSGSACDDTSYAATIVSAACSGPISDPPFSDFTLQATGTISGCGADAIFFSDGITSTAGLDCGTWGNTGGGGCVPSSTTATTTASWAMSQLEQQDPGSSHVYTVSLMGGNVTLASINVTCGP